MSRLKLSRRWSRRVPTPFSALTLALSAREEGSDGSDGSSSSVVVVVAVAGSGSSSELLRVLGGKAVASWAGDGPNCVAKASAGCVFRLVGTGSEGRAERLEFVTGPWLFRSFVLW